MCARESVYLQSKIRPSFWHSLGYLYYVIMSLCRFKRSVNNKVELLCPDKSYE